jgi:cullin-5
MHIFLIIQYYDISVNLCSNPTDKLQIYRENFEAAYIQATEAFYWVKAPEYLSLHGVENYMRYADAKLREEELRAQKYLEPNTASMQRLTECCVKVLVATFKPAILAECTRMIQHNQTDSEYYFFAIIFNTINFIIITTITSLRNGY